MNTSTFNAYDNLKDYIRARVKAQLINDVDGFELIEEDEQKVIIDDFIIEIFKSNETIIPMELAIIDDFKVLRTFKVKESTIWPAN